MLEFGADFDDTFFSETRERKTAGPQMGYNAKICESQWFVTLEPDEAHEEKQNIFKHKADYAYYGQQYDTALHYYTLCLGELAANNVPMWRDVQEARVRCLSSLAEWEQAACIAKQVDQKSQNFEQKTSSLNLLASVFHASISKEEEVEVLQRLLTLHPSNADLWLQLAQAYLSLGGSSCTHGGERGYLSPSSRTGRVTSSESTAGRNLVDGREEKPDVEASQTDTQPALCGSHDSSLWATGAPAERDSGLASRVQHSHAAGSAESGSGGATECRKNTSHTEVGQPASEVHRQSEHSVSGDCTLDAKSGAVEKLHGEDNIEKQKSETELVLRLQDMWRVHSGPGICEKPPVVVAVCTCLIRARMLLQRVKAKLNSFAKERTQQQLIQIDLDLDRLALPKDVYKCTEFIKGVAELSHSEEDAECDSKDGMLLAKASAHGCGEAFARRWFSWAQ